MQKNIRLKTYITAIDVTASGRRGRVIAYDIVQVTICLLKPRARGRRCSDSSPLALELHFVLFSTIRRQGRGRR